MVLFFFYVRKIGHSWVPLSWYLFVEERHHTGYSLLHLHQFSWGCRWKHVFFLILFWSLHYIAMSLKLLSRENPWYPISFAFILSILKLLSSFSVISMLMISSGLCCAASIDVNLIQCMVEKWLSLNAITFEARNSFWDDMKCNPQTLLIFGWLRSAFSSQ